MRMLVHFYCGVLFFLANASSGITAEWQMPPAEISTDSTGFSMSEADNNGHVMLLSASGSNDLNAYYYTNGAWTLSEVLLTSPSLVGLFDVAMDPSGTALAIFVDDNNSTVNTGYFNGSSWSTPTPNPLDNLSSNVRVAMNGPGQGVAIWTTGTGMAASFFSGGTWTPAQIIGGSNNLAFFDLAYSANGTVTVVWYDFVATSYYITNFDGSIWQAPQAVGLANFSSIGMDANGNAFIGADGITIVHFNANTSTIVSTQIISTSPTIDSPQLGVAPNGTAVATWFDSGNQGFSSVYNGVSWSPEFPFSFAPNQLVYSKDVSVDTNGNALVVWETADGSIQASRMALGSGVWSVPSELVAPSIAGNPNNVQSALSANGVGFASWEQQVGEFDFTLYANASINPFIPLTLSGSTCSNKFAMQTDIVNTITFTPSAFPGIVSYYLRRDGVLIAIIPASGPYIYYDHNRSKYQTYTYSLTAVDSMGVESTPAFLVMKG